MKKRLLLNINLFLLVITPFALSSGIMLEVAHGEGLGYMSNMLLTGWHIGLCVAMMLLVVCHLWLNWGNVARWWGRWWKHRSLWLKALYVCYLICALMGVMATIQWLKHGHTGLGGWHGKVGFAVALLVVIHLVQRLSWYGKQMKR